ncbi:putative retrotransposon hot spot (RHS) protein [Trypanosoma rangeli]|uniref:Putative retrotransposon hot spot (RHS) protein n=1 Tax=Trypanosoma rangeli TaxID=5698 RepID=A0A422MWC6_TRYRA|nr:putative retrotransposon hot spot (RHS) protein [Trypanosoma rangeli]RNE97538.1 putative retrotransposon hot spot (RHS) protein [Trypanosoma rangeli]|eukprot:RNE97538.1 putative retrotransposon hot spot (RHS) protein [Trypanosoma rangeli]
MSERREGESHPTEERPAQRRRVEGAPHQPRWTLVSSIKDVLNVPVSRIRNINLNDFLRSTLCDRGVVPINENVSIENFVAQPRAFIDDEDVLGLILASPSYTAIREEIEDARRLREDARMLTERGLATLRDWKEFAYKSIVSPITRVKLQSALAGAGEEARRAAAARAAPVVLDERAYRSVLNATWDLRGVGPLCGAAWDEVGGRRFQQASDIVE